MDGRITAYDEDYFAWTQEQARLLREAVALRVNAPLDFAHLAEEVEDMGKSDRRTVNSGLARIIEHLLKLEFSPAVNPRSGWRKSVREHRALVNDALADSPSLYGKLDLPAAYRRGRGFAIDGLGEDRVEEKLLPLVCAYTAEQLLDEDFWPVNRHGLE